jgi:hypothetical protein
MQIPDIQDSAIWAAAVGFIGSAFSLGAIRGLSRGQKVNLLVAGPVVSGIFTGPVIDWMNLPSGWWWPVAFLVGVLGWSTLESALNAIRRADLWALLSDLIRRRFGGD